MPDTTRATAETIVAVLLAAGQSSRFGTDKLMVPLASDAAPMALICARKLRIISPRVYVVIRPDQQSLKELLLANNMTPIVCPMAHQGMGYSLSCGITAAPDAAGWVIALADQPYIDEDVYTVIYETWLIHGGIVRPTFQGQNGHPVIFSNEFGSYLQQLCDDQGARKVIDAFPDRTTLVPVADRGAVIDIDHASDLPHLAGHF